MIDDETAQTADSSLVMARGSKADIARAKGILSEAKASRADTHAPAEPKAVPAA